MLALQDRKRALTETLQRDAERRGQGNDAGSRRRRAAAGAAVVEAESAPLTTPQLALAACCYTARVRRFAKGPDTWEISVADSELLIIGCANGIREFDTKTCKNPAAAQRQADKLIAAKLTEGFSELDGQGTKKKKSAKRSSKNATALRWECRQSNLLRLVVLDGKQVITGSSFDRKCYALPSTEEAKLYASSTLADWRAEGFRISEPERIPRSKIPPAPEPIEPEDPEDDPFEGAADISTSRADIVLDGDGASLPGFRSVLDRIAEAGSGNIRLEAVDYLPDALWMKAMSETKLPSVHSFEFDGGEFEGPDLGDLTALFESCPNLQEVEIQGGGELRRFTAERLRQLRIWDWSTDDDVGEALAKSRIPQLRSASIESRTGGGMTAEQLRAWLELGAPKLESLELFDMLDSGGALAGALLANAPNLTHVALGYDELSEFLQAIVEHGIPAHWKRLALRCRDAEDDDVFEYLTEAAPSIALLDKLEIRCNFGVGLDDTRKRFVAICPNIDYGGWED